MNIVYITPSLQNIGPNNQLYYISVNLFNSGLVKPIIFALRRKPGDEYNISRFKTAGIRILFLNSFTSIAKSFYILASANIVHSSLLLADFVSLLFIPFSRHAPRMSTIRSYSPDELSFTYGSIFGYLLSRIHMFMLKLFFCRVSCSNSITKLYSKHLHIPNTIENAVSLKIFQPCKTFSCKQNLRSMLFSEYCKSKCYSDPLMVLMSGSLITRKAPLEAISFLDSISKKCNLRICMVILGDGPLRDECMRKLKDSTLEYYFVGFVDNPLPYYQACDALISTSLSEGLPNSCIEALACGLPLILSPIPQHLNFKLEDNKCGMYIGNSSVTFFRQMITNLSEYSINANSLAFKRFSAESMSRNYFSIYSTLT